MANPSARREDNREMNDGGTSNSFVDKVLNAADLDNVVEDLYYKGVYHSVNQFQRHEIDLYNKTYRFGLFNPYGAISSVKEFLFFTKPDLNIFYRNEDTGMLDYGEILINELNSIPYWKELKKTRSRTIKLLQSSTDTVDHFNHLLQNQVISNLSVPGLEATTIETAQNMFGVGFSYHGSSEASDDSFDFDLEFKDTRWLDVYYFFKTYEEYETLKHHGIIAPWRYYIENKIIHDQFSIYKFLVDEDFETIIYYAKFYGVMPKSLPRDVFSSTNFDNGLSYSISFKAAFFDDMKPEIIADFNALSKDYYDSLPYDIDIHNEVFDRPDGRPAKAAYIVPVKSNMSPNGVVYKLKWRGSDVV